MINIISLNSVEEVFSTLTDVKQDVKINRFRSPYVYRGFSDIKYQLKTSLERNCNKHQKELEKCILRSFTKYASILENPHLINSEWLQLIIGQHHGLTYKNDGLDMFPIGCITLCCK